MKKTNLIWIIGIIFLISFGIVNADTCFCSNCADCMTNLSDASCTTVKLTTDILNQAGTCINDPANFNNKIFDCQGHTINGTGSIMKYGIYLGSSGLKEKNIIKNCVITNFNYSILIYSSNNTITNNTLNYNGYGISLAATNDHSSTNNIITNNILNLNLYYGIHIDSGSNNKIINNTANSNGRYGISIAQLHSPLANNNTIINNTANSNGYFGIYLSASSNNVIINNIANLNVAYDGISLPSSSNNTIINNVANSNGRNGIRIVNSDALNNNLENNTANLNKFPGIFLTGSTSLNTLSKNIVCNNNNLQLDINATGAINNIGIENTCQKFQNWNDRDSTGCNHPCTYCGNNNCDIEAGETTANCPTDCITSINCGDKLCDRNAGESQFTCLIDCSISGWTTTNNGWKLTQNKQLNGTAQGVIASTNLNLKVGKTYKISASIFNPTACDAYLEFNGLNIFSKTNSSSFSIVENTKKLSSLIQLNIKIDSCSDNLLNSQGILFDNVSVIEINESPNIPTVFDTYDFTQQGCCPTNWCWNGTACVNSSLWEENTSYPAIFAEKLFPNLVSGYRCIVGQWLYSEAKYDWDHNNSRFCPYNNQCYNGQTDKCIDSGSYTEDHYCWEGNWSSRTKFMAMQLLQFASDNSYSEYTMQCDNYENALNDFDLEYNYLVGASNGGYCGDTDCVNNFCILKYAEDKKEKVIIGTSFNNESNIYSFLKNITNTTETYCNNVINDGNFSACLNTDGKNYVWYNKNKSIVLYGKEPFTLNPPEDWMTRFLGWLGGLFGITSEFEELDQTMNISDFNKIYLSKIHTGTFLRRSCDKKIFAVNEIKSNAQTYHLQYTNFVVDICSEINAKYPEMFICEPNGNEQIVKPYGFNPPAESIWQDLTSKLRLKAGSCPSILTK